MPKAEECTFFVRIGADRDTSFLPGGTRRATPARLCRALPMSDV